MADETPRRIFWRALRWLGLSRASWNKQYAAGKWSSRKRSPHTLALVTELCGRGKLVEFGCGEGELPHLLPTGSFSHYFGIDISDVAVRRAREWVLEAGMSHCEFEQSDMSEWPGASGVSLILAEECLYYLKPEQIESLLARCGTSLMSEGKILVIVHSAEKHAKTLAACRRVCDVVNEREVDSRAYLVLKRKVN